MSSPLDSRRRSSASHLLISPSVSCDADAPAKPLGRRPDADERQVSCKDSSWLFGRHSKQFVGVVYSFPSSAVRPAFDRGLEVLKLLRRHAVALPLIDGSGVREQLVGDLKLAVNRL